jgi:hypothetical protein
VPVEPLVGDAERPETLKGVFVGMIVGVISVTALKIFPTLLTLKMSPTSPWYEPAGAVVVTVTGVALEPAGMLAALAGETEVIVG